MSKPLSDEARRLIDAPNIAHLTTLMEDGMPKAEPVWVGRDGDRIIVCTDHRSIKGQNIDRDPRVALSITDFDNPYEQLLIRGRVVEARDDSDLAIMDAISHKYIGTPFPRRKWPSRVAYYIEADVARYYLSPLKHTPPGRN
ncbi:MAG TPA: TIGR03618 family F420-dependent PPOX class oxidoreductase [Alphaproteobacteria bacterium]|jgi:PPOX class probable F420-dependent enzyme|nr:TIGR03618 family F420-dependent PPOX class oxidoreductase [Alphaproteobacteria bacterium]